MPDSATILVTGATGNTGSALLSALQGRDVSVRAMVRSAGDGERVAAESTEAVVADFDDRPSLEAALRGVNRAYLVTPSSEKAEEQQVRFVELAKQAGVEQIVLLSQLAAAEDSPVRFLRYHAVVERRIRELGLGFTLSGALGRSVTFTDVPPEAFAESLTSLGMPAWQVEGLLEDYEHYRRGEAEAVSPAVREVTWRPPRDIHAFAQDYAAAFSPSSG